jgi:hypothetical protein
VHASWSNRSLGFCRPLAREGLIARVRKPAMVRAGGARQSTVDVVSPRWTRAGKLCPVLFGYVGDAHLDQPGAPK